MPNVSDYVVLGFDFGTQRIGVAVGQTITQTAKPIGIVSVHKTKPDWDAIAKLIQQWRPRSLIVGIPVKNDGTEQAITHIARHFAEQLAQRFHLPVEHSDERFSSIAARSLARESGRSPDEPIDDIAAQIILQDWLQRQRS